MIQLEFTKAPNEELLGLWHWGSSYLTLGGKGVPVSSVELAEIEIVKGEILFKPLPNLEFYLINGKRSTQPRHLQMNDKISFHNISFKIISFYESHFPNKNDDLKAKLNGLKVTEDSLLDIIGLLTKE